MTEATEMERHAQIKPGNPKNRSFQAMPEGGEGIKGPATRWERPRSRSVQIRSAIRDLWIHRLQNGVYTSGGFLGFKPVVRDRDENEATENFDDEPMSKPKRSDMSGWAAVKISCLE